MKRVYLIPNMITAFGLSCGLFVIFKINMVGPGMGNYHVLLTSAILILVSAFADLIDGAVARIIRAESEFGFMFDSLADAISFGVAPSVLLLKTLSLEQGTPLSFFAVMGSMIYSICGVLRLVRFNVRTVAAKSNHHQTEEQKKNFTGLPITLAAMAAISFNLLLFSPFFEEMWGQQTRSLILTGAMFLLGYFMVSRWKFPSLKTLHFRVRSFHLVFMTAIAAIFILYGLLHFFPILFFILSWGYILLALILSAIRLIAGKKSKTLEEFEPEEESDDE
jgi:CDP-diacylglycerol---serine O-phosphatidyltransferase